MLLFFLNVLRAGVEGSGEIEAIIFRFRLSNMTASNNIRKVGMAIMHVMSEVPLRKVEWPDTEERQNICGLIYGFPKCVEFVEIMKQQTFRPGGSRKFKRIATWHGKEKEMLVFSGHQHAFCHSTLVWTDVYGLIIRIYVNLNGIMHDRRFYNNSEPYQNPTECFSEREEVIADTQCRRLPRLGFKETGVILSFRSKLINVMDMFIEVK